MSIDGDVSAPKPKPLVNAQKQPLDPSSISSSIDGLADGTEILYKDLHVGKKIGSGGYKEVYKGNYKGKDVAVGVISAMKLTEEDIKDIENETMLLRYDIIMLKRLLSTLGVNLPSSLQEFWKSRLRYFHV